MMAKSKILSVSLAVYTDSKIVSVAINRGGKWKHYAKYYSEYWNHDVKTFFNRANTLQSLLFQRSLNEQEKD
jgi:hypothetical protein